MRKIAFAACLAVLGLMLSASVVKAEEVDNPEYELWAKFQPGSFVVMKMEAETGGNKSETEYTHTLIEITKDRAVVEMKGHMMMGGNKIDIPPNKREIPAKLKKADADRKQNAKSKEGDEEIEVSGKKLKCHWTEMDIEQSGMKTHTKTWQCNDVPGHTVKSESHSVGTVKATSKMWAEKWEAK